MTVCVLFDYLIIVFLRLVWCSMPSCTKVMYKFYTWYTSYKRHKDLIICREFHYRDLISSLPLQSSMRKKSNLNGHIIKQSAFSNFLCKMYTFFFHNDAFVAIDLLLSYGVSISFASWQLWHSFVRSFTFFLK